MKPDSPRQDHNIIEILKGLASHKIGYPADLLTARRSAFLEQLEQQIHAEASAELTPQDQKVIELLGMLKSLDDRYPASLLAARRSAFTKRVQQVQPASLWQKMRLVILEKLAQPGDAFWFRLRTSLAVISALVLVAGYLLHGNQTPLGRPVHSEHVVSQAGAIFGTSTPEVKKALCKPGLEPPLCLAQEFDQSRDLTFQGNGSARPAVAKDTLPGSGEIHQAANVNDGLYGPGASWISRSRYSWIKIDLGKATRINTVTFGRDRLGKLNDGDPGRFTISVALQDNVYANGNSSNDNLEYTQVYDSVQAGFDGEISGAETVMAQFETTPVRFVKLTFENPGTAIDEVQVFLLKTPPPTDVPTEARDRDPSWTATPIPTSTPLPTDTALPTFTDTPLPTDTDTPVPTGTPVPTDTPIVEPTSTPVPTDTQLPTDPPPFIQPTLESTPFPPPTLSSP